MENTFPGFEYQAKEVSAYLYSSGFFTISLKNKRIIHFTPFNYEQFRAWLDGHKVRDVGKSD